MEWINECLYIFIYFFLKKNDKPKKLFWKVSISQYRPQKYWISCRFWILQYCSWLMATHTVQKIKKVGCASAFPGSDQYADNRQILNITSFCKLHLLLSNSWFTCCVNCTIIIQHFIQQRLSNHFTIENTTVSVFPSVAASQTANKAFSFLRHFLCQPPDVSWVQVLIRVHACGVNPVETYIRSGSYARKPTLPYTPGTDVAGVVESVGEGVTSVKVWVQDTTLNGWMTYFNFLLYLASSFLTE